MAANPDRVQDQEVKRMERMLRKREDRVADAKRRLADAKARAKHTREKRAARQAKATA